jgi:hypothetical protein
MAISLSPGWHEVLFNLMSVAVDFLIMSISSVPCLFVMFMSRHATGFYFLQ